MKISKHIKFATLAIVAAAVFTACEKDEPEVFDPVETIKSVTLNLEHRWGSDAFDIDANYEINGLAVKFDNIKYYLSNFVANGAGDNEIKAFWQYLLVDASVPFSQELGDVSFSMIEDLDFAIGLDELANHQDPVLADFPLNQVDMHWNWNTDAGYKFIVIEGFYDSDGDDVPDAFFDIHAASDEVYTQGTLAVDMPVGINGNSVNVSVDYEQFFSGIEFTPQDWEFADTHGSSNITNALATNAAAAISLD